MTFKVDEIIYDHEEGSLGVIYEGEPTAEEEAVVSAMMRAFAELIAREQERAEKFMLLFQQGSEEVH